MKMKIKNIENKSEKGINDTTCSRLVKIHG